ncbi:MAG: T9SS type A sorting domain-containing protein [Flavobacteriaceae bacterium]|nr:T9SS type A sorting domain-containing protein [Flavobacteriaceae bacterium]NNK26961.1 T9SS type A sorting domain-containing protein [Flavobacteriaceae bacterium]
MKKITFFIALLTVSLGYTQTLPLDFSDAGQAFTWDPAGEGGGAATINSVTEKLELFGNANQWDNAFIVFSGGDVVDLSMELNNTVSFTIDPLNTLPEDELRTHRIRLTTTIGNYEVPFTTTGDLEQTILINPGAGFGDMTELRIFIDAGVAGPNGNYAIDDIQVGADPAPTCDDGIQNGDEEGIDCGGTGGCPDCPGPPETAATSPTRDSADVLSIYSDSYVDAPSNGTQVFAGAMLNGITIQENNTLELIIPNGGAGFQNQYFEDVNSGVAPLDLTSYTGIHLDLYFNGQPAAGSLFKAIVQDFSGPTPINLEELIDVTALAANQWHSLDIAFADFDINSENARSQVSQLIFIGDGPLFGDIYLDNIYFYEEPPVTNDDCANATPIAIDGSTVEVSNIGATDSGIAASCDEGIISDVWYSFEGPAGGVAYFATNAPNLSVWDGCAGTELACNPGGGTAVAVTPGNTYYVRINDDGTARAPGTFTLTSSESSLLGVDDFESSDFKVYPNPANNVWNIQSNNTNITSVQVFDMLGKNVMSVSPNSSSVKLDATTLPEGLYFARISSESGTKSVKLVKQ